MTLTADTATVVNIVRGVYFIGEDHIFEFHVETAAGVAVDSSTWGWEWVLKESHASTIALVTKTSPTTIVYVGGVDYSWQFKLEDTDTLAFAEGMCAHSIRRTDAGLEKIRGWGDFYLTMAAGR